MKKLKVINSHACEYVAQGAYGKHTLVNIYGGDIRVKSFPATFPLAFYIEIEPTATESKEIKITVFQGRKVLAEAMASFEFEVGKTGVITLPPLPVSFTENTDIRVVATGEGFSQTVLIRKTVEVGEIAEL